MEKKRILIIDDEENFTRMVKINLELTDRYEVYTENESSKGLASAKWIKPDLILLDIIMSDTEGSEVAAQIKNDVDVKNIPIVFLTAVVRKEEIDQHRKAIGGHLFIAKPASTKEIIDIIEKVLGPHD
ncbi:MAG: response regulator [Candidatus Omnitrophota bacterium]